MKTTPATRPHRLLYAFFILHFAMAILVAAPVALAKTPKLIINADFERGMPSGIAPYSASTDIDTARPHSGRASLRITKDSNVSAGTFTFDLDGKIDFSANAEFALWVYAEPGTRTGIYIGASGDGSKRYTVTATPPIKPGQWNRVLGRVYADDWRKWDRGYKLTISTSGTCWIDDVLMATGTPDTPSQIWPKLKKMLHAAADKRVSSLAPGGTLALDARNAALAPDTAVAQTALPAVAATDIPAEGLLVFAIDAKDDLELTGTLHLEPDADLRPAIRVTVLCNDTVIGAPSVKAAEPWSHWDKTLNRPGPMPASVRGERPPSTVGLAGFRMTKGRHYITIAGPHIRPGGNFAKLELRAHERPAEKPIHTFGLLADTHIGHGRTVWSNVKLCGPAARELEAALRQLKRENAEFAIIDGDMTDHGRRKEIEAFASVVKRANLPVYGVYGNHDTFERTARAHYASQIPKIFPAGPKNTDYAFTRASLRFIVLDGSMWRDDNGKLHEHRVPKARLSYCDGMTDWLRETLAEDTVTPTIVISHYEFYIKCGVSDITRYDRSDTVLNQDIMAVLSDAPNVIATVTGHYHINSVNTYNGITCIVNPAFVEWPNAYRVCRVYADRLEWEIRQIPNRGLIREGVVKEMALLCDLHTTKGDLAGTIKLAPRAPAQ